MPAGFGFSVGDFVAAINLVRTVIDALKRTGGAKDDFTELIRQLYSLEKALIRVNDVELDDSQLEDAVALQHAASQCRLTIDEFLVRVSKYQPHLGQIKAGPAYLARAKAAWMAIRWAICEEKDVAKFRADLNAHVTSIELLLLAASIDASCEKGNNKSLITQLRDTSNLVLQKFSRIGQQIKDLQGMASQVVHMNLNIFHTVLHIQRLLSRIPPSIERQQPVLLTDPFGRISPFHLEFVRSSECFLAILRVHFQKAGVSSTKLEKREFFIQDVSTRLEVNLHDEWEACFQPGQHVVMSVVFDSLKSRDTNSCPHCQAKCVSRDNEDVEW
ncbi:hypothetical protein K469DRAFT_596763 [Zopfia rhizophila CBS 207.26]|uniref:Ubiquitin-like domain-containing protein n=1 Tax=Zopfia rhizophila CBS 207.26 TaxID=1314779 RepID=A0A6A6DIF8_9PEZI|nr:hypothetical protein K469DRAFT_596763 [Zopfia rhizophila CBS 207.26]